jgi:PKD repeat protein
MIQKLLALIASLIVALSGAVPTGLLPGDDAADGAGEPLELVTRPADDGEAQRLNVAWTKIDGEEVTDSRWGRGTLDRVAFKVGVHASPDAAISLAGEEISVGATDVLVVEDFEGRFAFKNVGESSETLLLDGTVQRTSVSAADGSRVTTQSAQEAGGASSSSPPEATEGRQVEQVVIGNDPVDGVSVVRGAGDRVTTQRGAGDEPANVLASWVRVDGEHIDHYLSGEGQLDNVTFQVGSYANGTGPLLDVGGEATQLETGMRVRVADFEGSYLVYQVENGGNRVRLDGVASSIDVPKESVPVNGGEKPIVDFSITPPAPSTSDTISFTSHSYDPDGGPSLVHEWTFGDGETSLERNPEHSYDEPDQYPVTLQVTDDDLQTNSTTVVIDVQNTAPLADFEWHPTEPTDVQSTQFVSKASDTDGEVVEHSWDFDDGDTAQGPRPEHTFPDDGTYEVTLTATDDSGDSSAVTRVVDVQNVPPKVNFTWDPTKPVSLEPVTFTSQARDADGSVESLTWSFDDGGTDTGSEVVHHFPESGTFEVTLVAEDDDGDTAEKTKEVTVRNRVPEVDFEVLGTYPVTGEPVDFSEEAVDRDGQITSYEWDFGDGNGTQAQNPTHAYGAMGLYNVTLTVTDDDGAENSTSAHVQIANAPPDVDFIWTPDAPYDETAVSFTDLTVDPDGGDDLVSWFWDFGDGNTSTQQNPTHEFPDDGEYDVTLHVEDSNGHNGTNTKTVLVRNQPPEIDEIIVDPARPNSRETINLTMDASDPDGTIVAREWELPNGTVLTGKSIEIELPEGDHEITARAIDDDGAPGVGTRSLTVFPAPPVANFTTDPDVPAAGQEFQFVDATTVGDAPIEEWIWNFDVDDTNSEGSDEQNPTHVYDEPGTYTVRLRVRDGNNQGDVVRKDVEITAPPTAAFSWEPPEPTAGEVTFFNATGEDPDPGGQIVNWTWNFEDDPDPVYGQNVTHTFPAPGEYSVQLVATDDRGASTTVENVVTVVNREPNSDFTYTPKDPLVGSTVSFSSNADDSDGTIVERIWRFGDGNEAAGPTVDHVYQQSGIYRAQLIVTDDGGATGATTQEVRVVNDHEVRIDVSVVYPDGQPVNLTLPDIQTSFRVEETGLTLGPNGTRGVAETEDGHSAGVLQAGEWAAGEPIVWTIEGDDLRKRTLTIRPPADAFEVERGPIAISTPLQSSITIDPGNRGVDAGASGPSPRYTDPTEPVTGNLTLGWATGEPVRQSTVSLTTAYDDVDPGDLAADHRREILTFAANTGDDGRAPFTVPPTLTEELGLYLPGWHEVSFQQSYRAAGKISRTIGVAHFYEDPAGLVGAVTGADRPSTDPGDAPPDGVPSP